MRWLTYPLINHLKISNTNVTTSY